MATLDQAGPAVNGTTKQGIFIINRGTLTLSGNREWWGAIYLVNAQQCGTVGSTGPCINTSGGFKDTVAEITSQGRHALFGDASHRDILEQAGLRRASHLIVTLPHSVNRAPLVAAARQISPGCQILVRARYLRERADLAQVGATTAVFEELEAAVSLTAQVLADFGSAPEKVTEETDRVRREILGTAEVL